MNNRPLKFRVWDKELKLWRIALYVDVVKWVATGAEEKQDNYIFTQFTGTFDKNKKEIFEGDILKLTIGKNSTYNKIFEVKYDFSLFETNGPYSLVAGFDLQCEEEYQLEIIGNIFENPELSKNHTV